MTAYLMPTNYPDSTAPEVLDQWRAARDLHRASVEDGLPWDCYNADCEHDDECPAQPFTVCAECYALVVENDPELAPSSVMWPCATARALGFSG